MFLCGLSSEVEKMQVLEVDKIDSANFINFASACLEVELKK
jgi:hypothetical protein